MLNNFNLPQIKQVLVVSFLFVLVVNQCALASTNQWANSGGLWGKRSAPPLVSFCTN
jgi:hypothetical protein